MKMGAAVATEAVAKEPQQNSSSSSSSSSPSPPPSPLRPASGCGEARLHRLPLTSRHVVAASSSSDYRSAFIESLRRSQPQLSRRLSAHAKREFCRVLSCSPPSSSRRRLSGVGAGSAASGRRTTPERPLQSAGGDAGATDSRDAAAPALMRSTSPPLCLSDYEFPFENLVFSGGGGKCRIYFGALKCLRDAGVRARRFGGTSSGAVTAALLAVNASPEKINDYMNGDINEVLFDGALGLCSALPNLMRSFGWNRGQRLLDHLGQMMEDLTGDKDITFDQIYRRYGNELCVAVVNVNLRCVEYFHVKTTPSTPVRLAVRMSMSIPGFFAPVSFLSRFGTTDYYVDGGLLCNYPVHAFDGWWLSMKSEDSYYKRLRPLVDIPRLMDPENRFGVRNDKTLGFLAYSGDQEELMQTELDLRLAEIHVARPDTKLYRKRRRKLDKLRRPLLEHAILVRATDRFLDALREADINNDDDAKVSLDEMQKVFDNLKPKAKCHANEFSLEDAQMLFGDHLDVHRIFSNLDTDGNGVIDYAELYAKVDQNVSMPSRLHGYGRREIRGFADFGSALVDSLTLQSMRVFVKASDIDRTVGLNTDYVQTTDFAVSPEDHAFLTEQGYNTTEKFLVDYIRTKKLPRKSRPQQHEQLDERSEQQHEQLDEQGEQQREQLDWVVSEISLRSIPVHCW